MHFVHFADVIGCHNMLMLKVCKSLCKLLQVCKSFCKLLEHLFYLILFYMRERHYLNSKTASTVSPLPLSIQNLITAILFTTTSQNLK